MSFLRKIYHLKYEKEGLKGLKFQQCFISNGSFEAKCTKFIKTLDDSLHKCFKKVRIPNSGVRFCGTKTDVQDLIIKKSQLQFHFNLFSTSKESKL